MSLRACAHSIQLMVTKGWRRVGKCMMSHSAGHLEDQLVEGRLVEMLKDANLPINWREIPSDESQEIPSTPMPPPPAPIEQLSYDDWVLSLRGWNAYYTPYGVPVAPPADVTQVSITTSLQKLMFIFCPYLFLFVGHAGCSTGIFHSGVLRHA